MGAMVSSDGSASGDEPLAQINVTSLIDVMFCLLIGFMVATPLMQQDKLPIDLPKARGAEISEEEFEYSVISIDASGQVFVGSTPLSTDAARMVEQLQSNARLKQDGRAFIQGDKTVPYERIVDILVALQTAGVDQVGFVTDPSKGAP